MKNLWRTFSLLLLLVVTALVTAPFTVPGTRSLLQLVERYSPLEIDYADGTLGGELRLHHLALASPTLQLEVDDLVAELEPACLWRSALCFHQLRATRLDIGLPPGNAGADEDDVAVDDGVDSTLFEFPMQMETDSLAIASTRIHWEGGEWRNGPAQLALSISGSHIKVSTAQLSRPLLVVRESPDTAPIEDARLLLPRINLPLELTVDELRLQQPGWELQGMAHTFETLLLRGHWRNTDLRLDRLQGTDEQWGTFSLGGLLEFGGDWPLALEGTVVLAEPPLWQGLHRRDFKIAAYGHPGALEVQLDTRGSPGLLLEAELDALDRRVPFQASLHSDWSGEFALGDLSGIPAELAELRLLSPLTASLDGNLEQQGFEMRAVGSGYGYQSMELSVAGTHQGGQLELAELRLRDSEGLNELSAVGAVSVAETLAVAVAVESPGIDLPGLPDFPEGRVSGRLRLDAQWQSTNWQLFLSEVAVEGSVNGLPARVEGHAGLGGGLLFRRSDLQAQVNGAQLALRFSGEQGVPGQFELAVNDLGLWQAGSRGQLLLTGEIDSQTRQLQFNGSLQGFDWNDLAFERAVISGRYQDVGAKPFHLDTTLYALSAGGAKLDSLHLLATGNEAKHRVSLVSGGDLAGKLQLDGATLDDRWQGRLAPTRLDTAAGGWALTEPVAISWSKEKAEFAVQAHCWRSEGARICPGQLRWGKQGVGSLAVSGDMGFLGAFMPSGVSVQGELDLRLEGAWHEDSGFTAAGASATRNVLFTRDFGEGERVKLGWDQGAVDIDYGREGLRLDWRIRRDERQVVDASVLLPTRRDGPLSGTVSLDRLQLATLSPFLPMLSRLQGTISGRFQLSGTIDDPLANGDIKLTGGALALVGNPTQMKDVELNVALRGKRAQLSGGGLLGGGKLQLQGELTRDPQWQLALSVLGEKQNILYPPSTELLISEDLQLTVGAGVLGITGELVVHEGVLEPEQLPEGSVAISADVVEVDYAGNVIREELPFEISMDVRVRVENRFRVTGTLINATLGGNLHFLQAAGRPLRIFGNLRVRDGQLRAYQQALQIQRGILSFTGNPDNPRLDVRARRQVSGSNVVVGVQVLGTFEALTLEVFSEPAMSQGETMSYLVRGRGLDASAGEDGTALAVSLASGVVNRSTIVSELNRIPGISNVAFGAEGTADDTAATVSGYIGNRIYLSYGFGLYEPINVLTARLYIRPRLWLEVVSRLENSVDLYYSFNLD